MNRVNVFTDKMKGGDMRDVAAIEKLIVAIAALLRDEKVDQWAAAFERFAAGWTSDPDQVAADILATYGGMGSLNDVVLYRNGQPLGLQNQRLDVLRTELYALLRGSVARAV